MEDTYLDFIDRSFEITESFNSTCRNCDVKNVFRYDGNNGFICTGIVRHPRKTVPFDVIRICITSDDKEYIDCNDYTPDEALTVVELLTATTKAWLLENQTYSKFRSTPP